MPKTSSPFLLLEGEGIGLALEQKAREEAPREAVGLLTASGSIIMLPNRSELPESNFELHREDLLEVLSELEHDMAGLTLWHSHPNGGVGPSTVDMQQRLPFLDHLIVTLTETRVLFTWY